MNRFCTVFSMLVATATLAPAPTVLAQDGARQPAANEALPSVERILARNVEAMGGRDRLLAAESRHMKGTIAIAAMGMEGDVEVYSAKPNQRLISFNLAGFGSMRQGFTDGIGWMAGDMQGAGLMEGDQLSEMEVSSDFHLSLHYAERYESIAFKGIETFGDQKCYSLTMKQADGRESSEYFSVDSGLNIGSSAEMDSPQGRIEVKTTLSEFKEFDGIKIATKMVIDQGPMQIEMLYDTITHNSVDASVFETPEEINELLKEDGEF